MSFVTRNGTILWLDGAPFKFFSFNTPNLHVIEQPWGPVVEFEQLDAITSLSMLGGKVTRIYVFSIPKDEKDESRHLIINGNYGKSNVEWKLNEKLMISMDRMLMIANMQNIKIIIPFIDHWEWFGGIESFSKMYGATRNDFYSNPSVINGFRRLVSQILNRNNSFTGVLYKNDKAILGWETGNELIAPGEWTGDLCKYIKSIDANHLVIDGNYGISESSLRDSCIDIVSNHYYIQMSILNYNTLDWVGIGLLASICIGITGYFAVRWIKKAKERLSKYKIWTLILIFIISLIGLVLVVLNPILYPDFTNRLFKDSLSTKPVLIGEIGLSPVNAISSVIEKSIKLDNIAGVLIWSLRFHSRLGGFYTHRETNKYYAYHYPGFPPNNNGFPDDEISIMSMITTANNASPPASEIPPVLSVRKSDGFLFFTWLGTAGASSYDIYRSSDNITFTKIATVPDNQPSGSPLFKLEYSRDFFYVQAKSKSNVVQAI